MIEFEFLSCLINVVKNVVARWFRMQESSISRASYSKKRRYDIAYTHEMSLNYIVQKYHQGADIVSSLQFEWNIFKDGSVFQVAMRDAFGKAGSLLEKWRAVEKERGKGDEVRETERVRFKLFAKEFDKHRESIGKEKSYR